MDSVEGTRYRPPMMEDVGVDWSWVMWGLMSCCFKSGTVAKSYSPGTVCAIPT